MVRRGSVWVACLALVAGGCRAPGEAGDGTTPSTAAPAAAPTAAPEATPGTAAAPPPPVSASRARPGSPPAVSGPATTVAAADAYAGARRNPGQFAPTLLGAQPATRLVLEVLAHEGAVPNAATVSHLRSVLAASSGKAVTVSTSALPAGGESFSPEDVRALGDRHGRISQGSGQAVVRIVFLEGRFAPDASALGAAVRGDTAAVFTPAIRESASVLIAPEEIEVAIAAHEVGHLLGLVDLVRATGRADPEHPGHSPNRESVMYWALESGLVSSVFSGPPPRDFDADDRADLAAIRAGA